MSVGSNPGATSFVPKERTIPVLKEAVQKCHGCNLYRDATQAAFGELEAANRSTKSNVAIMIIGEQPGDRKDKQGRPLAGPAGILLHPCLEEADIDRRKVYVTNTVKHFKWQPRRKLRIHKKTSMTEVHACRPWLEAELRTLTALAPENAGPTPAVQIEGWNVAAEALTLSATAASAKQ